MAGDFVMVQFATARKIEVHRIAAALGIPRAHAFGLCVEAWIWFDEQTEDGVAKGATPEMLDAIVGAPGFTQALSDVGWIRVRQGSLELPNFDRLMGKSAKKRVNDAIRQRKRRDETPEVQAETEDGDDKQTPCDTVTNLSRGKCDESVTKRREEKSINTSLSHEPATPLRTWKHPPGASPAVCEAIDRWQAWLQGQGQRPDNDIALETSYAHCLAAGWDQDKIARAIAFSIHKRAKSWIDPDYDYQVPQAKPGRPKVDPSKVKF